MPPASKRRRTSGQAAPANPKASTSAQQSTLSFRSSKAGAARPSAKKTQKKHQDEDQAQPKPATTTIHHDAVAAEAKDSVTLTTPQQPKSLGTDIDASTTQIPQPDAPPQAEAELETDDAEDDPAAATFDARALALPDAKIKAYWAGKERERKAPRVHQDGLGVREKVLREFDMTSRYGPSIGIPRLSRWRRAHALGMEPPVEVLAVLLKEEKARGKGVGQMSIMDELIMSSRVRGESGGEVV